MKNQKNHIFENNFLSISGAWNSQLTTCALTALQYLAARDLMVLGL